MIPAIGLLASVIQLAPALTKVLGFSKSAEEIANTAAALAKTVTGTTDNDAALEALKDNPELLQQYQRELLDYEKGMESLYIQDKENARLRDIEFLKSGTRNYRGDFLVGISVIVVFSILGIIVLVPSLSEYAKGGLTTILGVFLNQLTNAFNFEFGTTRKDDDRNSQITTAYIKGE